MVTIPSRGGREGVPEVAKKHGVSAQTIYACQQPSGSNAPIHSAQPLSATSGMLGASKHPRGHHELPREQIRPVFDAQRDKDLGEDRVVCTLTHARTHYA